MKNRCNLSAIVLAAGLSSAPTRRRGEKLDGPWMRKTKDRSIFLLRHGAIDTLDGERRYVGRKDVALSELGGAQALTWAERFEDVGLAAIYSSPLRRCLDTATMIGKRCGMTPVPVRALQEIDLGAWDGRRRASIRKRYPTDYARRGETIADFHTPDGESFSDLQRRAWPAFEDLAARHTGPILVVTHAGVIRVLLCRLLKMPLTRLFRFALSHGTLTIVLSGPDGYRLQAFNLPDLP